MICWWPVVVVAAIALPAVASLLEPDSRENRLTGRFTSPAALPGHVADVIATAGLAVVVVAVAGAVAGLVARWRRGGPVVRQQVSLLALAACPPAVLLPVAVFDAGVPSWAFSVVLLPMPVAIAIAVLTRGLYDLRGRRAAARCGW